MVDRPEQYRWSSYQYYIRMKKSPRWLISDFILGYFDKKDSDAQEDTVADGLILDLPGRSKRVVVLL